MQRKNDRFVERLPLILPRPSYAYLCSIGLSGLAFLLREAAAPLLPSGYPFLTFFPAVILSSFLFGVRPGIFTAVLCGVLSWYFFIPPYGQMGFNPSVAVAMLFYTGVVGVDIMLIHFMQRANLNLAMERERNRTLAENRELLFHELQHRVSNNLQVVAAMLALQRRQVDHDLARRALDDASARIGLVGRISRALYDPSGSGQDMKSFLSSLAADIVDASGRQDVAVGVNMPDGLRLDSNATVPVALIVAESVSNAIEHGLPARAGEIRLCITHDPDRLILDIADDGDGVAPDFVIGTDGGSLGLRIAQALAAQLGGDFTLHPGETRGALARLTLPAAIIR